MENPRSDDASVDRISNLPEEVIGHILSFLWASDVVRTCVLSRSWKSRWTKVTTLNFGYTSMFAGEDAENTSKFERFVNRFLLHVNQSQRLQKFHLRWIDRVNADPGYAAVWMSYAITRSVGLLDIIFRRHEKQMSIQLPGNLFTCETLQVLKLSGHFEFKVPRVVCLPKLEVLELNYIDFESNECIPNLLRGCPELRSLEITTDEICAMRDFIVVSNSLRRFEMFLDESESKDEGAKLEMDAPNLEYLKLIGMFEEFSVKKLNSVNLVTLDLSSDDQDNPHEDNVDRCNSIVKLVEALRHVKFLNLEGTVLGALIYATTPLGMCFERLTELDVWVELECCHWSSLGAVLGCSPKLQFLSITVEYACSMSHHKLCWSDPTEIPQCLSSSLKKVSIEYLEGLEDEMMMMIRYILQHGDVLEAFTLKPGEEFDSFPLNPAADPNDQLLQRVSTFPRSSRSCRIHFE